MSQTGQCSGPFEGATAGGRPSPDNVERAARELVARHGSAARSLTEERVARLERAASWGEHATALRVLTAVEQLLAASPA